MGDAPAATAAPGGAGTTAAAKSSTGKASGVAELFDSQEVILVALLTTLWTVRLAWNGFCNLTRGGRNN